MGGEERAEEKEEGANFPFLLLVDLMFLEKS